jgi:hypothetical protein
MTCKDLRFRKWFRKSSAKWRIVETCVDRHEIGSTIGETFAELKTFYIHTYTQISPNFPLFF